MRFTTAQDRPWRREPGLLPQIARWEVPCPAGWSVPRSAPSFTSVAVACLIVVFVSCVFLLSAREFFHWFVLPVAACGVLVGADAIEWCRPGCHAYDPCGILGLVGFHFFFLAPLLHVYYGQWMAGVAPPPDWRDWLGYMGALNFCALLVYRLAVRVFDHSPSLRRLKPAWRPRNDIYSVIAVALAVTGAAQAWVVHRYGGLSGYVGAYQEQRGAFVGMGPIFMISESFPVLCAFTMIIFLQRRGRIPSWAALASMLVVLFGLRLLVGGLRGSRGNTVVVMFWVVGAIHFLIRPVPKRLILVGVALLLAFMYVYAFYKGHADFSTLVASEADRAYTVQRTGRSFAEVLVGDLARADVQAYILYRLTTDRRNFSYARGQTYLSSLMLPIPRLILPKRLPGKVKAGTEAQFGPGTYQPDVRVSSRVYALGGEAMLNFPPIAVPLVYGLLGFFVARVRSWIAGLPQGDLRLLLAPFAIYLCITMLVCDSDNLVFRIFEYGFVPVAFVLVSAVRSRVMIDRPLAAAAL